MAVLRDTVILNLLVFITSWLVTNDIRTKHVIVVNFDLLIFLKLHDLVMN